MSEALSRESSWGSVLIMPRRTLRAASVTAPKPIAKILLSDTEFDTAKGWQVKDNALETIVPRAPTHEPYPYHNLGVDVKVKLEQGKPPPPPGAPAVPAGVVFKAL